MSSSSLSAFTLHQSLASTKYNHVIDLSTPTRLSSCSFLHNLFLTVPSSPLSSLSTQSLEVLRFRVLLGHTRSSHDPLVKRTPSPCPFFTAPPISINHVLFQCPSLTTPPRTHLALGLPALQYSPCHTHLSSPS